MKRKKVTPIIELTTIKNDNRPVFIAGDFNGWNAADPNYKMVRKAAGHYFFSFPDDNSLINGMTFKLTRGGWADVEVDDYGCRSENRVINLDTPLHRCHVNRWRWGGWSHNPRFSPIVEVVNEAFEIPQLGKKRRVCVLLPHNYYDTDRHYPVLYLQDGQNLFDDNAPFGNWAIDKRMAVMAETQKDFIVVAVDHGEVTRINEFTPSDAVNLGIGRGEGTLYLQFIVNNLKPFIDQHYRTKPERNFTGFGGSSMGGLLSVYAGFLHAETFGNIMVFSPSLWIFPDVYRDADWFAPAEKTKFYFYGGEKEGANVVGNMRKVVNLLIEQKNKGFPVEPHCSIDKNGVHNEERWGIEFPRAVEWLFFNPS